MLVGALPLSCKADALSKSRREHLGQVLHFDHRFRRRSCVEGTIERVGNRSPSCIRRTSSRAELLRTLSAKKKIADEIIKGAR
jgi:hypothetical protein